MKIKMFNCSTKFPNFREIFILKVNSYLSQFRLRKARSLTDSTSRGRDWHGCNRCNIQSSAAAGWSARWKARLLWLVTNRCLLGSRTTNANSHVAFDRYYAIPLYMHVFVAIFVAVAVMAIEIHRKLDSCKCLWSYIDRFNFISMVS